MMRLTSAAGMSLGATVMKARGTGRTTDPISARSRMSDGPTDRGSIKKAVDRVVNIPLRITAGIMLNPGWLRIMTKFAAMSRAVKRARRSPRTLPAERLPLKTSTIPVNPAATATHVRGGTLSERNSFVRIAAKRGIAAMITRVFAADVRRMDITKETVLTAKKVPDRIPAYPMRKVSLITPVPNENISALARVHDVRSPLQKTRVHGSADTRDIRRASGLKMITADIMNRVPFVLSLR
jgi:hypothetical protein